MDAKDLKSMDGTEWPKAVGEMWERNRSRFSSSWDDLSHHDQVAVYRVLLSTAANAPS